MEEIKYEGKLFQIVDRSKTAQIRMDGTTIEKEIVWELASRPPGVRALIMRENSILLNREYRYELDAWDYRLPGGKVFDTLKEYKQCADSSELEEKIYRQLRTELREEADIDVHDAAFLRVDSLGFRIQWDLYYFLVRDFEILPSFYSQDYRKSKYEFIEHRWVSPEESIQICLNGQMRESRSAYTLMWFLLQGDKGTELNG